MAAISIEQLKTYVNEMDICEYDTFPIHFKADSREFEIGFVFGVDNEKYCVEVVVDGRHVLNGIEEGLSIAENATELELCRDSFRGEVMDLFDQSRNYQCRYRLVACMFDPAISSQRETLGNDNVIKLSEALYAVLSGVVGVLGCDRTRFASVAKVMQGLFGIEDGAVCWLPYNGDYRLDGDDDGIYLWEKI